MSHVTHVLGMPRKPRPHMADARDGTPLPTLHDTSNQHTV